MVSLVPFSFMNGCVKEIDPLSYELQVSKSFDLFILVGGNCKAELR